MKAADDTIAAPAAPPATKSRGLTLADLDTHQCRFPLHGGGVETRFCADEVFPGDWLPGSVGGSYCRFHRMAAAGQGTLAERMADSLPRRVA